jgi:pyruvate dehydrogenase E1 component
MFGFQRVGDFIWAAADSRCKGFLMGATAGRTTLAGEGLQHQDGHSHILALTVPNLLAYDVTFAYELAVIIKDGIRRMYVDGEDIFYYITIANENYAHCPMPEGVAEDILKGMYRFQSASNNKVDHKVRLLGSGCILNEVTKAAAILEKDYGVASDIWAVPSYKGLHRDALDVERWNHLHPDKEPRIPHVTHCLADSEGPVIAASDYMKALPDMISRWVPGSLVSLGTDGFGRSDSRARLRAFFEVDAAHITFAALSALAKEGRLDVKVVTKARKKLGIDPKKINPRDV